MRVEREINIIEHHALGVLRLLLKGGKVGYKIRLRLSIIFEYYYYSYYYTLSV